MTQFPKEIFKAYDIRGIVGKTLTPEIAQAGRCACSGEAYARAWPAFSSLACSNQTCGKAYN